MPNVKDAVISQVARKINTNERAQALLGSSWFVYLCIMGAGFVGACLRYLCGLIPLPSAGGFPVNTLMINMVGSYCIFMVFQHAGNRLHLSPQIIKIINTGLLGAFTTLSAFCVESIQLYNQGAYGVMALYIALTFTLSFGAVLLAVLTCDILAALRLHRLRKIRAQHNAHRPMRHSASAGYGMDCGDASAECSLECGDGSAENRGKDPSDRIPMENRGEGLSSRAFPESEVGKGRDR